MNCDICLEPFDHSIHKPCHLACPHTFCLSCLNQLTTKKCPTCNKTFVDKNPNIALLKWIPESSYDLLKAETLKELIEINEAKKNIKSSFLFFFLILENCFGFIVTDLLVFFL